MTYQCIPNGVCSKRITFDLVDGKLHNVQFTGGCNGNLKAISKLVEGMDAGEVIRILKGTSCADQFALAIEQAEKQQA